MIHQIHESMGGIFYSRSSDGGANFSKEEVVNYTEFIKDADGNKNSFLNIIRGFNGSGHSNNFTDVDNEQNVVACWERYNASTQKTEIRVSKRNNDIPTGHSWHRYDYNNALERDTFCAFPSNPDFNSYPKVFLISAVTQNGGFSSVYGCYTFVAHLEPVPNSTNKKIVVTAKFMTQNYNYVIDEGNISDVSVAAPYNNYRKFKMHFAYIINNVVKYKEANLGYELVPGIGGFDGIFAPFFTNDTSSCIVSTGDGMQSRISPDISIRNGKPVITYRGYYQNNQYIYFQGNSDNFDVLSINHYPVIVRYKNTSTGNWESFIKYDGTTPQENPNIEGSITANGYLLNFKKNGAYYQFAKIDGHSGYNCNPGSYSGTDAKLVRKSYIGEFGAASNPMLLTLSSPAGNLYTVGKQSFTITNQIAPIWTTDGFSNLAGTITKDNIQYNLNLGPIMVSNTTQGGTFDDGSAPSTVTSNVEFNETMRTSLFGLSNNDTLILGTYGYYMSLNPQSFQNLVYHVNLMNYTSGQIERELFKDTIKNEDTIGTEFLRGFVIKGLSNQTDSFFVQLFVDSTTNAPADYAMSGIYTDNSTGTTGDNLNGRARIKVFFENNTTGGDNNSNLPISYNLSQNYPNPFNPVTKINFAIPKQGYVNLKIYDMLGREVKTLMNEVKTPGNYSIDFNASNLSSGIYFYKLQVNDFVNIKKMVVIK